MPMTLEQTAQATREARARRRARRLDLHVVKSRRDGTFMLVDDWTNAVVAGAFLDGYGYGLSLELLEDAINERAGAQ